MNLRVIDVRAESLFNCFHVGLVLVRGDLWPSHDAKANVDSKVACPPQTTTANQIGHTEFGISIYCNPSPRITPSGGLLFRCSILGFGPNELPNFVTLNSFSPDGANLAIMKTGASAAHILKELEDRVFCHSGHAHNRINAAAFH